MSINVNNNPNMNKHRKKSTLNYKHILDEFSCSIFTGIIKVSIIQPFDFIRFRIQSNSFEHHFNISKFIRRFITGEGLKVFLKGVNVTTFSVFMSSIIQFTLYQQFFDFMSSNLTKNKSMFEKSNKQVDIFTLIEENKKVNINVLITKLSMTCAMSGLFSGLVLGFLLTPVDNVRIKLQAVQNIESAENRTYRYKNSIECVKQVLHTNGLKGLYIALPISVVRESIASLIYFGSFEHMKNLEKVKYNRKRIKILNSFFYGAFAGGINWIITLPIDIIKTKMISDTILPGRKQFSNYRDCARQIYNQMGFGGFYKGFSVVFTRALIVNGVVLTCFDICRSNINSV